MSQLPPLAPATTPKTLRFWLPGVVVPKARPCFGNGQAYLPQRYRTWRQLAETEVLVSLSPTERASLPIPRAEVLIQLVGAHRGDLDNIAGSVLDVLVEVNVLVDDRLSCVPRLVIEHQLKGARGAWIDVVPIKLTT